MIKLLKHILRNHNQHLLRNHKPDSWQTVHIFFISVNFITSFYINTEIFEILFHLGFQHLFVSHVFIYFLGVVCVPVLMKGIKEA